MQPINQLKYKVLIYKNKYFGDFGELHGEVSTPKKHIHLSHLFHFYFFVYPICVPFTPTLQWKPQMAQINKEIHILAVEMVFIQ